LAVDTKHKVGSGGAIFKDEADWIKANITKIDSIALSRFENVIGITTIIPTSQQLNNFIEKNKPSEQQDSVQVIQRNQAL
jgi:hypothetical protein